MTARAVALVGVPGLILLAFGIVPRELRAQLPCEIAPVSQCSLGGCTAGFVCAELEGRCACIPEQPDRTPTVTPTVTPTSGRIPGPPAVCKGTVRELELPSGTRHRLKCTGTWTDDKGHERKCEPAKTLIRNGRHWETREVCVCRGQREEEKPCRIVIRRFHGQCSKSEGVCEEDADCPQGEVCQNVKSEVFCAGGDDCADGERCCLKRTKVGDPPPQNDVTCSCTAIADCK